MWLQAESRGTGVHTDPSAGPPAATRCADTALKCSVVPGKMLGAPARTLPPGLQASGLPRQACGCQHPASCQNSFQFPFPTWLAHVWGRRGTRGPGWFSWLLSGQSPGSFFGPKPKRQKVLSRNQPGLLSEPGPWAHAPLPPLGLGSPGGYPSMPWSHTSVLHHVAELALSDPIFQGSTPG